MGEGEGGMEVGEEGDYIYSPSSPSIYTCRYTVTTRLTCMKMGSDDSHFLMFH